MTFTPWSRSTRRRRRTDLRPAIAGIAVVTAAALAAAAGCTSAGASRPDGAGPGGSGSRASGPAGSGAAGSGAAGSGAAGSEPAGGPAPDAPIRADAAWAAAALTRTDAALGRAIDAWRARGGPARGEAPAEVVLPALYEQRIYRFLARRPALARRTLAALRRPLAARAGDDVAATRELLALTRPRRDPRSVRTRPPLPAGTLLGYFKRAGRRFGVSWQVLAAVMHVESKFGRVVSSSTAGAQGPMQFLPATWKAYGLGGDIHDPRDAVMGAANYLRASGAPRDYARALHAYNPDRRYVDAVLRHAHRMTRDPRAFYAYYNWQVFVRTTHGDVRLTGPPCQDRSPCPG
jgi:hypothetical protein